MPTAITIRRVDGKPGSVYYPLTLLKLPPHPAPTSSQITVQIQAFALNHRDLFIRQHLYPGTTFGVPLCADGVGIVTAAGSGDAAKQLQGKRVVLHPASGWDTDPRGPEDAVRGARILGGTKLHPLGTAITELVLDASEAELAPEHLSDAEAAALPLVGLTAWRATMVKLADIMSEPKDKNVLITGIGGGVAIMALLYCIAKGVNVYVTSGGEDKIKRAVEMGAKGGVSYKEEAWEKKLLAMARESAGSDVWFDAIVDGTGGDIVDKGVKILRHGGIISSYGMTLGPKISFSMAAVLKSIEFRGSTMGSNKDFRDMLEFVNETKVKPIVSRVVKGLRKLDEVDSLFTDMKEAKQFGKLVVEVTDEDRKEEGSTSKL
jgi:NADPH:quinone reductase-like Zn-dependent oxidoreductase